MPLGEATVVRFGAIEVHTAERSISNRGTPIALQRKPFDLLLYLLHNANRAISKDEIFAHVWPDEHVTDNSLTSCVVKIRRALADDPDEPTILKTIHGFGYRLSVDVSASIEDRARAADVPVHGTTPAPTTPPTSQRPQRAAIFVGRAKALDDVQPLFDRVASGRGTVLLLSGDAGMGKTSLLTEMATLADQRDFEVLWSHGGSRLGTPPLYPWSEIVRAYVESHDASTLVKALGTGAVDLAELVPSLRDKLADLPTLRALPSELERARLFDSVLTWLSQASAPRPLVLVFDDLHWADRSSLSLLESIARRVARLRILVLGAYRPTEPDWAESFAPLIHDLLRDDSCTEMKLCGLAATETAELLRRQERVDVSHEAVERIWKLTGGNPFFVTEIGRDWSAQPEALAGELPAEAAVPITVRRLLDDRIARLSPPTRAFLDCAALLGADFSPTIAARLSKLTNEELAVAIDEATKRGILTRIGDRYPFTHALWPEVLYENIPLFQLPAAHYATATALAEDGAPSSIVAHHLERARPCAGVDEVLDALLRAAADAVARFAYETALRFYESALNVTREDVDPRLRALRAQILVKAADAYRVERLLEKCRVATEEAVQIALEDGDGPLAASAAISLAGLYYPWFWRRDPLPIRVLESVLQRFTDLSDATKARANARLACLLYADEASDDRRLTLINRAVAMARACDVQTLADVQIDAFLSWFGPDHTQEMFASSYELIEIGQALGDDIIIHRATTGLALSHFQSGNLGEVERTVDDLARLTERLRARVFRIPLRMLTFTLALHQARFAYAERVIEESVAERMTPEDQTLIAGQMLQLARAKGQLGGLADAFDGWSAKMPELSGFAPLVYLQAGRRADAAVAWELIRMQQFNSIPSFMRLPLLVLAAESCAALEDRSSAGILYDALAPYESHWAVLYIGAFSGGSIARYLGLLAGTLRHWAVAGRHFAYALASYERNGAKADIPVTRAEYARMLLRRDGAARKRGAALLEQARREATEVGIALPDPS